MIQRGFLVGHRQDWETAVFVHNGALEEITTVVARKASLGQTSQGPQAWPSVLRCRVTLAG